MTKETSTIAMDYFTKWLEAYAIPSQEALTVVEALISYELLLPLWSIAGATQ
jgi:hypothetical protein